MEVFSLLYYIFGIIYIKKNDLDVKIKIGVICIIFSESFLFLIYWGLFSQNLMMIWVLCGFFALVKVPMNIGILFS